MWNSATTRGLAQATSAQMKETGLTPIDTESSQYRKLRSTLKRAAAMCDPDDASAFARHIEEMSQVTFDTVSLSVKRRRDRVSMIWHAVLTDNDKSGRDINTNTMFEPDFIKANIKYFLPTVIATSRPMKGHTSIRSTTLDSALQTLLALIIFHCRCPMTGRKEGYKLLTEGGFFVSLSKQALGLIFKFNLERTPHAKLFFGREPVHSIAGVMLSHTELVGLVRLVALQSGVRMLMTFYTTMRPSTAGPTEAKWAEAGMFPKLGNITVYRLGFMKYRIKIILTNFKGNFGTVDAATQEIIFEAVLYAHNAFLDITVWFIAYLFARGAFEKKYETCEEFYADESAEIVIDLAKAKEPLFCEVTPGGQGFTQPLVPASAASGGASFSYWCVKAKFPRQGLYALRRDAGNMYALQFGRKISKALLNHSEGVGVLEKYYSRGLADVNFVSVRLGEAAGPKEAFAGEAIEKSRASHQFQEFVVEHMIRQQKDSPQELREKRAARRKAAASDPQLVEVDQNLRILFEEFKTCFTLNVATYNECSRDHLNRIYNIASSTDSTKKTVSFIQGLEEKAVKLRDQLDELFEVRMKLSAKLVKKATYAEDQARTRSYFENSLSGTTKEREEAAQKIKAKEVQHLEDLVHRHQGKSIDRENNEEYDEELLTEEMIHDYRYNNEKPVSDPLTYTGNVAEWERNLRREIRLETLAVQEEEDEWEQPQREPIRKASKGRAKAIDNDGLDSQTLDDDILESYAGPVDPQAKDLDESKESDVLGLNVDSVRQAIFEYMLKPILREKDVSLIDEKGTKTYPCKICESQGKEFIADKSYDFNRHQLQQHSPWKKLESRMREEGSDILNCPGCSHKGKTVSGLFRHMVTDKCANAVEFRVIKAAHDAALKGSSVKPQDPPGKDVVTTSSKVLEDLMDLIKFCGEDVGELPGGTTIEPSLVTEWAKIQLAELHDWDFETFTSQAIPEGQPVCIRLLK